MIDQAYGLLTEGYFEDAVTAFSDCLSLDTKEARVYLGRGEAYFQLKKWKEAIADFEKARELDCEEPGSWLGLALSLVMDSRIYEAIGVYEALLARKPRLVRAHIQLAMLYYRLGVIAKGHRQLDIALVSGVSLAERKTIEDIKKEQLVLDKKRYYRPDFAELHRQDQPFCGSFFIKIIKIFNYRGKTRPIVNS